MHEGSGAVDYFEFDWYFMKKKTNSFSFECYNTITQWKEKKQLGARFHFRDNEFAKKCSLYNFIWCFRFHYINNDDSSGLSPKRCDSKMISVIDIRKKLKSLP